MLKILEEEQPQYLAVAFDVKAQEMDISDIDRAVRSSGSRSIMFKQNAEIAREEIARRKAEEEAMRAEQEAKMRQEQAMFREYNLFGNGLKIVATINGEMISNKDLQERANLFALTSGININDKNAKMVKEKVMQGTVDEKIKLQEAEESYFFRQIIISCRNSIK